MHESVKIVIKDFSTHLNEVFKDDLTALVLYGSAAGNNYQSGISDINVLVILEKSGAGKIFEFGKEAKSLIRKYRISPFIMTREEFASAADVFPLEYCDILDLNEVIIGPDSILNIKVNMGNLRTEVEGKLRGAISDICSMVLEAGGNEKTLADFLLSWSGIGTILFRGLLRLKKKAVSGIDTKAIISNVEKEYGVDLNSFTILNDPGKNKILLMKGASKFAGTIIEPLKILVRAVDAMDSAN